MEAPKARRYRDQEIDTLLRQAQSLGIPLWLAGYEAIRRSCPNFCFAFDTLQRPDGDIDIVSVREHRGALRKMLAAFGYGEDQQILLAEEGTRYVYVDMARAVVIDLFIDELYFCHPLELRRRLFSGTQILSPSDLLLSKLQIREISQRDVTDASVLLLEHPVTESDDTAINASYISSLMSPDWGFWYTATQNLRVIHESNAMDQIGANHRATLQGRIRELEQAIARAPKTWRWRTRRWIGTRMIWYRRVSPRTRMF